MNKGTKELNSNLLSIIIPLFNEEEMVEILTVHLKQLTETWPFLCEVVFVNDGSTDQTLPLLEKHLPDFHSAKIVNLSKNFGHQAAYMAGISHASGDALVLMDGDLQDPPKIISDMFQKWEEGYQVVVGVRKSRKEPFFRRFLFELFHKLFFFLSDYPLNFNSGMFSLIDQCVAKELLLMEERNRFIPGLRDWVGFTSTHVYYNRDERACGTPKQSLKKLIQLALDAIFSFSYKPLRLTLFFGMIVSFLSFTYGFVILILRIFKIDYVKGFATIVISNFFLSGVILISVGILGEYIGRIYDEIKRRPLFIIKDIISHSSSKTDVPHGK